MWSFIFSGVRHSWAPQINGNSPMRESIYFLCCFARPDAGHENSFFLGKEKKRERRALFNALGFCFFVLFCSRAAKYLFQSFWSPWRQKIFCWVGTIFCKKFMLTGLLKCETDCHSSSPVKLFFKIKVYTTLICTFQQLLIEWVSTGVVKSFNK
jgi:hypothetical protein